MKYASDPDSVAEIIVLKSHERMPHKFDVRPVMEMVWMHESTNFPQLFKPEDREAWIQKFTPAWEEFCEFIRQELQRQQVK